MLVRDRYDDIEKVALRYLDQVTAQSCNLESSQDAGGRISHNAQAFVDRQRTFERDERR